MKMVDGNTYRFFNIEDIEEYRSAYRRDYARILHSASFRRLENKTQLFPGGESDFFRNRLTHSLEVAQIAKTIALKIIHENENLHIDIEPDVCEIAGLVHDLGHPPFGHNGEKALNRCMAKHGGFEGNAQTLRILTRLEKKEDGIKGIEAGVDNRVGLNLTSRVIASALKYDEVIPINRNAKTSILKKGYYESESKIVETVKKKILGEENISKVSSKIKTIECAIMDLADDIAYSTYDLEDAFKGGFLTPLKMLTVDDEIVKQITTRLKSDGISMSINKFREAVAGIFASIWQKEANCILENSEKKQLVEHDVLNAILSCYASSNLLCNDGYQRSKFTSYLVNLFINGIEYKHNDKRPILSEVEFNKDTKISVGILKHFTYVMLINSSRLKVAENRGEEIVERIFEKLTKGKDEYLPDDFRRLYNGMLDKDDKARVICDFIAGMTDRYALEFYGRLYSENPETIFKPI